MAQSDNNKRPTATNREGAATNLPPRPNRADFESDDDFEEALSGWNYRVRPLLSANRTAAPPAK